jgi:hypothetical protein
MQGEPHFRRESGRAGERGQDSLVAGGVVLGAGVLAFVLGGSALSLVREELHISCSMREPGFEGSDTWMCADGIGYLGAAVTLGAMWALATVLGSLIAGLVARSSTARVSLVLLATASGLWILWWTWYGSSQLVGDEYSPLIGVEYWVAEVGPAAAVCLSSLVVGILGSLAHDKAARWMCAGAAAGLVVATVLEPGLSINFVPASGLLAAAATRTERRGSARS